MAFGFGLEPRQSDLARGIVIVRCKEALDRAQQRALWHVLAAAGITEDELLAISAAVAAYLGVRAHIRQVRLIQSTTWGQIGRLNVHASHQRRH